MLKKGTLLLKIRNKGVRGLKVFKRKYRLNIADLKVTYASEKSPSNMNCASPGGRKHVHS